MARDLKDVKATVESRFQTQWASATPVAWPGMDFDTPDGAWVRLTLLWGDGSEGTLGGSGVGKDVVVGVLQIDVFDKPGNGAGNAEGLADDAAEIFDRVTLSTSNGEVRFDAPSGPKPAGAEDTDWIQRTVDCPFEVDQTV